MGKGALRRCDFLLILVCHVLVYFVLTLVCFVLIMVYYVLPQADGGFYDGGWKNGTPEREKEKH